VLVLPALRSLPRDGQFRVGIAHPRVLDLYAATGLFDQLLPAPGASAPWTLRWRMQQLRLDRALVFTEAPSGGWLAWLSRAPLRMGRAAGMHRMLFTHPLPRATRQESAWREHAQVAQAAGGAFPLAPDFRLPLDPAVSARAAELLPDAGTPVVALAPGAAYGPAKRWPLEYFAELCRRLSRAGFRVMVTGSNQERDLGAALAEAGALDLTGKTSLLESVAILKRARVLVTNDSGALHLARAAGTPVVALFGSSSPVWTGPGAEEGHTLQHSVPCSPCFRRECPLRGAEHLRCLRGISVEAVLEAVTGRREEAS
jgi:lipopolysaccharide heptosyltransferase II